MTQKNAITETLDLLALADGRLDDQPAHKRAVEAAAARNPDLAARLRAYRAQTEALHRAYDPILTEPLPEKLSASVEALRRGARHRTVSAWSPAAAVVLAVTAAGGGWFAARIATSPPPPAWTNERAALPAAASRAMSPAPDAVIGPKALAPAPDLSAVGLQLVGQTTMVPGDGTRYDYRTAEDQIVSLFLHPRAAESASAAPSVHDAGGITIVSWNEAGLTGALAGPIGRARSLTIADAILRALRTKSAGPSQPRGAPPRAGRQGLGTLILRNNALPGTFAHLIARGRSPWRHAHTGRVIFGCRW